MAEIARNFPVLLSLASLCYVLALLLIFSKKVRSKFAVLFHNYFEKSRRNIDVLDSYRGFAALWVASFHTWQWNGPSYSGMIEPSKFVMYGNWAVSFFCVLSGFLLHRSIRKRSVSFNSVGKYLFKRLLRIYPVYFVSVLALLFLGYHSLNSPGEASLFLKELFMFRIFSYDMPFINPPAWSIYVEELFYIVLPLWLLVAHRKWELAVACTLFIFLVIFGFDKGKELVLFKYFAAGIIVSLLEDKLKTLKWRQAYSFGIFTFGAFVFYASYSGFMALDSVVHHWASNHLGLKTNISNEIYGLLQLALALSCIVLGSIHFKYLRKILEWAPFRIIGAVSFSIYIWHSFVIIANTKLRFAQGGIVDNYQSTEFTANLYHLFFLYWPAFIAAGLISYFLFERPFLVLKEKVDMWSFKSSKPTVKPHLDQDEQKNHVAA